jgi:hypothetical protein
VPGLIRGVARTAAIAGTATAVSNRVSRRQAGRWAAQDQAAAPPPPPPQQYAAPPPPPAAPAPAPAAPAISNLDQLERLGQLHADGILTDEEFTEAKAKILNS